MHGTGNRKIPIDLLISKNCISAGSIENEEMMHYEYHTDDFYEGNQMRVY